MPSPLSPPRVVGRSAMSTVLVVLGWLASSIGLLNVPGVDFGADLSDLGVVLFIALTGAWITVFWRRRLPMLTLCAGAGLALAGIDYLLLLIAAHNAIAWGPAAWRRRIEIAVPLVVVAFTVREMTTPWGGAISELFADVETPIVESVVVGVIAALSLGAFFGANALTRSRRQVRAETDRAARERDRAEQLGDELARQHERERIARDLHDSVSRRLSLISMRSGVIEQSVHAGDGRAEESARALREETVRAADDIAALVRDLRTPSPDSADAPRPDLRGVAELVREHRGAGGRIEPMIMLDGLGGASEVLQQAVYRALQECLTNVRKHAPDQVVRLFLEAGPETGVRMRVDNALSRAPSAVAAHGGGVGHVGMRERIESLGGTIWIGSHEGEFIVDASLPWLDADA